MIFRTVVFRAVIVWFLVLFSCAQKSPLHPVVTPVGKAFIDPQIVCGVLPNGFQYILRQNTTPKDKVSIHLNVFAGSIQETEGQRGVAHFLEHMLFNGSEHFAPGELAQYFPTIGMDYGADANAQTSFFNTVYDLMLPDGDKKQMDKGFVIIQDYAKGALLLETEIERERGVILAEKRERDSISYQTYKKILNFELLESRFVQRFPIGTEDIIQKADQKLLKEFYDQWYRPENMVLIVVGDFDTATVQDMIIQRFSKLVPRAPLEAPSLDLRWKDHKGDKAFYHYEPEAGSTDITIETIEWKPFQEMTPKKIQENTLANIANMMLQNRLSQMVTRQTAKFSESSVVSGTMLHHASLAAVNVSCDPEDWEICLGQVENSLRQCLVYGFDQKELDRVTADYLAFLEQQDEQSNTRKTRAISKGILNSINQKEFLLSARQKKNLLFPYIKTVTLKDVQDMIRQLWEKDHRLILVTGNAKIDSDSPTDHILDVYSKSSKRVLEPYQSFESKIFPYLEMPDSETAVRMRQDNINDLGITTVEFENNVRMNIKRTDFNDNEFLFKVCFGAGQQSEPVSKPGLSILAQSVFDKSGFSRIDADQLSDALSGRKLGISFDIQENYFSLSGSAAPEEIKLVFDLIHHYFMDPGFRQQTLDLSKVQYRQKFDSLSRTPEGIMQIKGEPFLSGYHPSFGLPHPEILNQYTLNDIKSWLKPELEISPVEISIAGDVDTDTVIHLASKYMGGLKNRKNFPYRVKDAGKIKFPEGERLEIMLNTKTEAGVVRVAFLTDDFWDISQTRRLHILSRVLSERLRLLLREELGQTYSPYVYNDPSIAYEGYGVMHVVVNVKPDSYAAVYDGIKSILDSLAAEGITEKETQLALNPVVNHVKTFRKTNGYWLNSVMAHASQNPKKFDWAKTMMEDYSAIDSDDLNALAKRYLNINRSAEIIIKSSDNSDKK
ncbi:MAG: insulinase family protein [Proteobacteria bacterium]|nr:insulinase family protein [Pseudomonadota bacterium]MBU1387696.1 insulinase family protein [Pseudomonadota bacterium]MBU1543728.1 insulinase family protein [Pseudomonadota bacterium]